MQDEKFKLDRSSAVPLYHQLQEILKQQIEAGSWQPGFALPSEPELARRFGVSRVVVRMALSVLEDDHQITRIRGRGTFVSRPKLNYRAGGLSRMLDSLASDAELEIQVLDKVVQIPEESIRRSIGAAAGAELLRLTTLVKLRGTALAIGYSFFNRDEAAWLEEAAQPNQSLPKGSDIAPRDHGIDLIRSDVAIESTASGQFDAEHFGLPLKSPEFLISVVEHRSKGNNTAPFEVARFGYRADVLQFRLEVSPEPSTRIQATWALVDSGWPPPSAAENAGSAD